MAPNSHPSVPDTFYRALLARFLIAVLEHVGETRVRLIGEPPPWLLRLYPEAEHQADFSIDTRTPVLHNFLHDAAAAWDAQNNPIARSGFWTDHTMFDEPQHFDALAFREGDQRLLLVQHHTETYDQQAALLQEARERALRQHEQNRGHQRTHQVLTTKLADSERSRDDLAAILQQLGLATLLIDGNGHVRFLSDSAVRLLEVPPSSASRDMHWETLLPSSKPDRLALQTLLRQPVSPRERARCHIETPTGRRLWLEIELHDDPRDSRHRIAFLHDMTDVYHLRRLLELKAHFHDLIGKSRGMTQVYEQIHDLARVDSTVLIEGETGTGKELVARLTSGQCPAYRPVYRRQLRRPDRFIARQPALRP